MIPDNVEKIIMTKENYDRTVEQTILERNKYMERIEAAIKYIVKSSHSDWSVFGRTVLLRILRGKDNE